MTCLYIPRYMSSSRVISPTPVASVMLASVGPGAALCPDRPCIGFEPDTARSDSDVEECTRATLVMVVRGRTSCGTATDLYISSSARSSSLSASTASLSRVESNSFYTVLYQFHARIHRIPKTHMFRLVQFTTDSVDVHNALRGVVVAENLSVELAQTLGLFFSQCVLHDERVDFR